MAGLTRRGALAGAALLLGACQSRRVDVQPSVEFTRVPQADEGGRDKHDIIEGRVSGAREGQQIVLYAKNGSWWLQPLVSAPFTKIQPDSKWRNATHLGTEYAALLVDSGYRPPAMINTLPARGGDIAAVTVAKGENSSPSASLQFSGYEWRIRSAPSNRGGTSNLYDSSNAWTDANGFLHLRIAKSAEKWTCAEVTLTRSFGYGTYSFAVRNISQLEPAAVFGLFTWDYSGTDQNGREMDIEISRWGDPASKNAQYVVQPYHIPANVSRFSAPSGALTHSFRWEPERLSFRTVRGRTGGGFESGGKTSAVAEHVFTSGVPSPGIESVRMNLYAFVSKRSDRVSLQKEAEVVIEKFEYLP